MQPEDGDGTGLSARAVPGASDTTLHDKLRALRKQRGLSIAQVSEMTGISSAFLSQVENGKNDITVTRLMRLVEAFGVSVADLLPGDQAGERGLTVVRAGMERRLTSPSEQMEVRVMSARGHSKFMPALTVYEPGGGMSEAAAFESEEVVYVLEGEIELEYEGEVVTLNPGDVAYFDGRGVHRYRNLSDGEAKAFSVTWPAIF
ncbi:helix-turn-helix domain-containing protein [Pseudonocardia sp.]|uniref:helix-turn-helix domain-containing protein n=1 Tax=Pseudonocardia sp. TaxID=60912 RepID=UPI003D0D19DB